MKNLFYAIIAIVAFSPQAFAQSKVKTKAKTSTTGATQLYSFSTELCDNKGYYDSTKYKKEEIDGAYQLTYKYSALHFSTPTAFNLNDLADLKKNNTTYLQTLEKEYTQFQSNINSLRLPNDPYWTNLRKQVIAEADGEYQINKTYIAAIKDVNTLKTSPFYKSCSKYIDALTSNNKQIKLAAWKELAIQQSKNNSNPQGVINTYNIQSKSAQSDDYALIELLTFGYSNCANDTVRTLDQNDNRDSKFRKLFVKIKETCDEP